MVYAIVFEFRCERKREAVRQLASIEVSATCSLADVSEKDPRRVYARIVEGVAVAMGVDRDEVVGEGELLYVIPIEDVVGGGSHEVDGWAARRGLLRALITARAA